MIAASIFLLLQSLSFITGSVQHSKSFLVDDLGSLSFSFTFDQDSVYVPISNDVVQRSLETGAVQRTFRGHNSAVMDVFLVNETLYSGSDDGMIIQWDLDSGTILRRINIKCYLDSMQYFQNTILASCSSSQSLMFDLNLGIVISSFEPIQRFFAFGEVFYTFNSKSGIFGYKKDLTMVYRSSLAASIVICSGESIFAANMLTYDIYELFTHNDTMFVFNGEGHYSYLTSLCVVDKYLLSGGKDRRLIVWDIASRVQVSVSKCRPSSPLKIGALSSSSILLSDDSSGLFICNIKSDKLIGDFNERLIYLASVAVYEDFLFSSSRSVPVKKWSISSRNSLTPFPENTVSVSLFVTSHFLITCDFSILVQNVLAQMAIREIGRDEVNCNTFFYDGGFVFAPSLTSSIIGSVVNKYNLSDGELVLQFYDASITTFAIDIFCLGQYLFVTYLDPALSLVQWNLETGILQHKYAGTFFDFEYSSFGTSVLIGCKSTLYLINPGSLTINPVFDTDFVIVALFFDENTRMLYAADNDIFALDTNYGYRTIAQYSGHTNLVRDILVHGDFLFSCSEDGTVKQWSLITRRLVYSFEDRGGTVSAIGALNNTLIFGTLSGALYSFNISSALLYKVDTSHTNSITDIIVIDQFMFISCEDETVSVRYQLEEDFVFHTKVVPRSLATYAGFLFTGNTDLSIIQWNLTSNEVAKLFLGHNAVINDIKVDHDVLYSAGSDNLICRWSLDLAVVQTTYKGHLDEVSSILLYEQRLYSASFDKTIIVWDIETAVIVKTLKRTLNVLGHLGPINFIVICNGNLFSASSDLTIKQWDVNSGFLIDTLFGHSKAINCLFCHDYSLFSGSDDFSVFLWCPSYDAKSYSTFGSSVTYKQVSNPNEFVSNDTTISMEQIRSGIIVSIVVVLIIICIILCVYRRKRPKVLGNVEESSILTTEHTINTLFTQALGMAIPGFLEFNATSFRLLKKLARGGGGTIFLAEILNRKGTYIAKLVANDYTDLNSTMQLAFDQEITLMDFLKQHRNIAKIVGFCRKPCCILMKYYEKGSFKDLLHSKSNFIGPREICKYIHDISSGLQFLKPKCIVHGDLKPDNILVDSDYDGIFLVLSDFGIAQITSDKYLAAQSLNIANIRGLSVHYAAPEMFQRFRNKINTDSNLYAIDVFSLGVIIYEVLERRMPWSD